MTRPPTQTLLFSGPTEAISVMKLLVGSGMEPSRISIQTWGSRIAIRPRDPIGRASLDEIVALGGEILTDPAMGLLAPAAPDLEPDRGVLVEAVV